MIKLKGKFVKGHKHSEEIKKRISDTRKIRFKEGKIKLWNEGLTKDIAPQLSRGGVKKGYIPWNKGIPHTEETKRKISITNKGRFSGENNPNWNGGVSFEPYGLEFNKELKEKIRTRDNHTCQLCKVIKNIINKREVKMVVHHIDYDKRNNNPNNLITLCTFCNSSVNKSRNEWTNFFNMHLNRYKTINGV